MKESEQKPKHFLRLRAFLIKPSVKMVILTALTVAISVLAGMLGSGDPTQPGFLWKLIALFACIVIYVLAMGRYTAVEVNSRRTKEELGKQIAAFSELGANVILTGQHNASTINKCIHVVNKEHQINQNIWCFQDASMQLCEQIYSSVCMMADSKKYEVTYIALDESRGAASHCAKMLAYANQNMTKPRIHNVPRNFSDAENEPNSYYDMKLFCREDADITICWGADEVDQVFRYKSQQEQLAHRGKYRLYIGIPVFCDNRKMVGLLQIVGKDDTMLGCHNRQEAEEIASKMFVPYANIFLLIHKMEKALFAGVN